MWSCQAARYLRARTHIGHFSCVRPWLPPLPEAHSLPLLFPQAASAAPLLVPHIQADTPFPFRSGIGQWQSAHEAFALRLSKLWCAFPCSYDWRSESPCRRGQRSRLPRSNTCANARLCHIPFSGTQPPLRWTACLRKIYICGICLGKSRCRNGKARSLYRPEIQKKRIAFVLPLLLCVPTVPEMSGTGFRSLCVNQFVQNRFLGSVVYVVHPLHPEHLILRFQFLGHALGLRHLQAEQLYLFLRLPVDFD